MLGKCRDGHEVAKDLEVKNLQMRRATYIFLCVIVVTEVIPMNISSTKKQRSKLSREQSRAEQLVQRIRKLHWMGMDGEALQLQQELSKIPAGESVLLLPANTD